MYLEIFSSSGSKVGFHAMVAAIRRVNRVVQLYLSLSTLGKPEHQCLQPFACSRIPE
jgi:hypothetical protein